MTVKTALENCDPHLCNRTSNTQLVCSEAWTYLFLVPSFLEPKVVALRNGWGRGGRDVGTRDGGCVLVTPALEKYIT